MSSACGSDADAAARDAPDAEPLVPKLVLDLKGAGVDPAKVDEFISLLASCNVHSRGALLLFTASLDGLIDMLFEDTQMGALKAKGFAATVRVPACAHQTLCPCPLRSMRLNDAADSPHLCCAEYNEYSSTNRARSTTCACRSGKRCILIGKRRGVV